ncbi:MAG: hypothetical protein NVSMB66_4730 [Candidatus Doudnabacteria bacterium]
MQNVNDTGNDARLVGKGPSKWPWILGLLLILIIGAYILSKKYNNPAINTTNVPADTHGVNGTQSIMTNFDSVYHTANIGDLYERPIEINNLVVRRVLNDKVFTVSNDASNPIVLYVMHIASTDPNQVYIAFHPGQRLNIKGVLHKSPSAADLKSTWGLNDADSADAFNRLIYATSTNIAQTPISK